MFEHRSSPRLRTIKGGTIIADMSSYVDCVIRNVSETGAALEVENPVRIPDDFVLLIRPQIAKRRCHVVWRGDRKIGVRFT